MEAHDAYAWVMSYEASLPTTALCHGTLALGGRRKQEKGGGTNRTYPFTLRYSVVLSFGASTLGYSYRGIYYALKEFISQPKRISS